MICFNCGSVLSPEVFDKCTTCGMNLSVKCSSCSAHNPRYANYCFNCGTNIRDISPKPPSIISEAVLSDSRRQVAVIFADVSGFTALSEKRDPEEVRDIINQCFEYITKPVYALEGTIDKYIGDCIMILFGAKYTHSDDPLRAVKCALEMMELIKNFSRERLSSHEIDLSMSIGINFGLVVTGKVGNYYDKDYTVMGDVVNTAQRLQSHASSGTILVSESTYLQTMDMVEYSSQREIKVKNKEKPVKCYEPRVLLQSQDKDGSYLIERQHELSILEGVYTHSSGTPAAYVIGPQGVGKTSLVKRFLSSLPPDNRIIWNTCSIQSQSMPFNALSSIIYMITNIGRDGTSAAKSNALKAYLNYLFKRSEKAAMLKNYYFLGLLLGLQREREFEDIMRSMKYEDITRELSIQVNLFFERICLAKRYIFILENHHWVDKESDSLLAEVMYSQNNGNAIFIVTSRSEDEIPAHRGSGKGTVIKVDALLEAGAEQLACCMLNAERADSSFLIPVMKVTRGNPLYIREYINALNRKGKVYLSGGVLFLDPASVEEMPSNIEGLIQSRLSELSPSCLTFLQTASVLGGEFDADWIFDILNSRLSEAEMTSLSGKFQLITFKGVEAKSDNLHKIYSFTDSLVRDVLYSSLLNREKNNKHKSMAEYIETAYSKELDNYYTVLGYHFIKSGCHEKAVHYYYKAAMRYKGLFMYITALEYFYKCIDLLADSNLSDRTAILSSIYYEIGAIYFNTGRMDESLENLGHSIQLNSPASENSYSCQLLTCSIYKERGRYEEALDLLNELQSKVRTNSGLYGRLLQLKCSIYSIISNRDALRLAEESENILLKNKDYDSLSETMNQAGLIYFCSSDIENAIYYLNKAYEYAEKINNLAAIARSSGDLGVVYHYSGRVSKAEEYFLKSLDISQKISNIKSFIYTSINLGILYMDKGIFGKAKKLFENSLQEAKKSSLIYPTCVASLNLGDIYYEGGQYDLAVEEYSQALKLSLDHKLSMEEGISYIGLAKVDYKMRNFDSADKQLEKAYNIFNEAGELSYLCDYYKLKGKLALQRNDLIPALYNCNLAINNSQETQNDINKLKCLRLKGIILCGLFRWNEALACFDESIGLAMQLQSDYELAKCYYRKAGALEHSGREDEASKFVSLSAQAINKVDYCRWTGIIISN